MFKFENNQINQREFFGLPSETFHALEKLFIILILLQSLNLGSDISQMINDYRDNKQRDAKEYSLENETKMDTLKFYNEDFIKEVALSINKDKKNNQILNEEKIEKAIEKISDLICLVEQVKLEIVEHLNSDEYLNKLIKEMNVSKEKASEHIKVRINNIKNLSYSFKKRAEINKIRGDSILAYAYHKSGTNEIILPYDIDLDNPEELDYLNEAIFHEILHESTMDGKGISANSKKILRESFRMVTSENLEKIEYYSDPAELIVRKQILDKEMESLGIMKYGEEFTHRHFLELLDLLKKHKLSQDSRDFIEHIKPAYFIKVMNELAKLDDNGKTNFNSAFNYNNGADLV